MNTPLPNNGNVLVDYLHENDLLRNGMTAEQIETVATPLMQNPNWLKNDSFWEDVFYRADELNYKLAY